ncbi:3-deoxy-manno-octulosonate cytidylyltransferase [candidate division WOR-3 bacterium]|nr:3-deoxy-manno-octulosonate cytidylyltransferase [candidate division WOR-3 bacterium]
MILGVIPVRIGSKRLPFKPLLNLGGKPLFFWAVEKALECKKLDEVLVATDSKEIAEKTTALKRVKCVLTPDLPSGSDRAAWVSRKREDVEIVANIQGDEPFICPEDIDRTIDSLLKDPLADMATLYTKFDEDDDPSSPDKVKIVSDRRGYALYFSRAKIPYPRDGMRFAFLKHLGLYVFRMQFLINFTENPTSTLEKVEMLEQLRALEMGAKIKLIEAKKPSYGIDTEEDYKKAQTIVKGESHRWHKNTS